MPREIHHAISYIEFGVNDLPTTRAFYEAAFEWEFNDYGPAYSGIRSRNGDGEIGGLNTMATPSAEGALVLLFSADLEATLAAVKTAGGTIVEEPYDFPGGRRFEFLDSSGNRLGVYAEA